MDFEHRNHLAVAKTSVSDMVSETLTSTPAFSGSFERSADSVTEFVAVAALLEDAVLFSACLNGTENVACLQTTIATVTENNACLEVAEEIYAFEVTSGESVTSRVIQIAVQQAGDRLTDFRQALMGSDVEYSCVEEIRCDVEDSMATETNQCKSYHKTEAVAWSGMEIGADPTELANEKRI